MRQSSIENMAMFPTRSLGNSSLQLTPIGLGAWAIGGEWRFGWGPQDDAASIATIRRAIERGINWIDTAAISIRFIGRYGPQARKGTILVRSKRRGRRSPI